MAKNVDWAQFGITAQTQRRIIASLCEVLDCGYGEVNIKIHQHKIAEVNWEKKERMTEGTTPCQNGDGLAKR